MDPNVNIAEQRTIARRLTGVDMTHEEVTDAAYRLAELVLALHPTPIPGEDFTASFDKDA